MQRGGALGTQCSQPSGKSILAPAASVAAQQRCSSWIHQLALVQRQARVATLPLAPCAATSPGAQQEQEQQQHAPPEQQHDDEPYAAAPPGRRFLLRRAPPPARRRLRAPVLDAATEDEPEEDDDDARDASTTQAALTAELVQRLGGTGTPAAVLAVGCPPSAAARAQAYMPAVMQLVRAPPPRPCSCSSTNALCQPRVHAAAATLSSCR